MSFKDEVWHRPTIGGDVGGVAVNASLALQAIRDALSKIAGERGVDIEQNLAEIDRMTEALDGQFEELTGWTGKDAH